MDLTDTTTVTRLRRIPGSSRPKHGHSQARRAALAQYDPDKDAMSNFNVAGILRAEPILREGTNELRRPFPTLRPMNDHILAIMEDEVLKPEVVEGERPAEALKGMRKARRPLPTRFVNKSPEETPESAPREVAALAVASGAE